MPKSRFNVILKSWIFIHISIDISIPNNFTWLLRKFISSYSIFVYFFVQFFLSYLFFSSSFPFSSFLFLFSLHFSLFPFPFPSFNFIRLYRTDWIHVDICIDSWNFIINRPIDMKIRTFTYTWIEGKWEERE